MPRRKKPNHKSEDLSNFRMVYLDFNDREKREIADATDQSIDTWHGKFEEWIDDGWKIGISYSSGWDNYVLSITPKEVPDYPRNIVFMARHASFGRLMAIMMFFFGTMVENNDVRLRLDGGGDHSW